MRYGTAFSRQMGDNIRPGSGECLADRAGIADVALPEVKAQMAVHLLQCGHRTGVDKCGMRGIRKEMTEEPRAMKPACPQ